MNPSDDLYKTMVSCFRITDLQVLLGTFNCNKVGRKSELLNRALEILNRRTLGIDYDLYHDKIFEIYNSLLNIPNCNNNQIQRNIVRSQQLPMNTQSTSKYAQQQKMFLNPQYSQQSIQTTQAGFPQMQLVHGGMCENNYTRYGYQNVDHHNVDNTGMINQLGIRQPTSSFAPTRKNTDSFLKHNINFTKLPFYDVLFEILKPGVLTGYARCSLPNAPIGIIS